MPIDFIHQLPLFGPELFIGTTALALLLLGAFAGNRATGWVLGLAVICLALTAGELATNTTLWVRTTALNDMFVTDAFASVMKALCLVGLAFALLISGKALQQDHMQRFEYPILVVLSGLGMMFMISANDLLTLYVGLELSSLALYVLAAFRRETVVSAESGMKYFILGALSSGMLLFGTSLVYGFGGTTNYDDIASLIAAGTSVPPGMVIGMVFILAGIAFKISAVPFHMWTPDVYHGAPPAVTALFAMVPKIAALGLLIRLLFVPFAALMNDWVQIVAFIALASMIWGAIAAISQTNIKRLLAYSSIGNMGYALIGVVAGTHDGISATVLYLAIYLVMTAGLFGVLLCIRRDGNMAENIDDFGGLSRSHPMMAYVLAIMLFAMAGIPPLAGFFGKFMVFKAAVDQEFYALAIAGVVTSVLASYYYLNLIRVMFFQNPSERLEASPSIAQQMVILFTVLFVLGFILLPEPFLTLATAAAQTFTLSSP